MKHLTHSAALELIEHGDLAAAELICRDILQFEPTQRDALYLLGVIAYKTGHLAEASKLMDNAQLFAAGDPHRLNTFGVIQTAIGKLDAGIEAFRLCVALDSSIPAFHNNLAHALSKRGDRASAEAHFRYALTLQADYPEACLNLANILSVSGDPDEAEALYRRALTVKPDYSNAAYNLGLFLKDRGRLAEALEAFNQAIQLAPNMAMAHNNLGIVLRVMNRIVEAEASFRRALELDPNCMEAIANLGNVQDALGHTEEALRYYEKAQTLAPDLAELRLNRAYALLKTGNYREGWLEHEWRWKTGMFRGVWPNYSQPQWDGGDIRGMRILLWYEQGLGDTLQFIRYTPLVATRGATVIALCQPPLKRLLQTCEGIDLLVEDGEPLPDFDIHCPLMSLPLRLGTELATVPAATPYLFADTTQTAAWQTKLDGALSSGLKVGLVWAGNPRKDMPEASLVDARRSISLTTLTHLLKTPGVTFFSLQKSDAAEQLHQVPERIRPLDFSHEWRDFADTAAFVATLDLVITVDTSVAHLAGALGKETWVLSRADGCWRWLEERTDSPWYPTLRLFRQAVPGDWESVVEEVTTALNDRVRSLQKK